MMGNVGMEVYLHAFSTTTLNGSEFLHYVLAALLSRTIPPAPTVQDVGWGPSVVILNIGVGTRREFGSRRQEKKRVE